MVKVNYIGIACPEREFGNLRDAYKRLRDLQGSCTPMGEDYLVLAAALEAFKAAAVHFTKDPTSTAAGRTRMLGEVVPFPGDRRRQHRDVIGALGLTHKDRARIRAMAIRTREGGYDEVFRPMPLDAPFEVMAVAPVLRFSGQTIGMLEGCAILIWPSPPLLGGKAATRPPAL